LSIIVAQRCRKGRPHQQHPSALQTRQQIPCQRGASTYDSIGRCYGPLI
jgi:hypothetical protein